MKEDLTKQFVELKDDTRGASIVIGAVLLVGITIVLLSVVLFLLTSGGLFNQEPQASAGFAVEESAEGVEIRLVNAERAETMRVLVNGDEVSGATWTDDQVGYKLVVQGVDKGDRISIVGTYEGEDTVVQKHVVKGSNFPGSTVSVVGGSGGTGPTPICSGTTPYTVTQNPADGGAYTTILAAVSAAPDGGVVEVCDSKTYTEETDVTKDLTIRAVPGAAIDVSGGSLCGGGCAFNVATDSRLIVEGLTITGGDHGIYAPKTEVGLVVRDTTIQNTAEEAIYAECEPSDPCIAAASGDITFDNVTVTDSYYGINIEGWNDEFYATDLYMENIETTGINVRSVDYDWTIENSEFRNIVISRNNWEDAAIKANYMKEDHTIRNVVIDQTTTNAINLRWGYNTSTVTIEDVEIRNSTNFGIYLRANEYEGLGTLTLNRVTFIENRAGGNARWAISMDNNNYEYKGDINLNEVYIGPRGGILEVDGAYDYSGTWTTRNSRIYDLVLTHETIDANTNVNPLDFQENCWYTEAGSLTTSPSSGSTNHYEGSVDVSNPLDSSSLYC